MSGKALTLRVTLRGSDPEVWRLVQVSAEMTLAGLSGAFEDAMGWHSGHLHRFKAYGNTYWTPPGSGDDIDGFKDGSLFRKSGDDSRRRPRRDARPRPRPHTLFKDFKDDSLVDVGDILCRRRMKLQWDYDLGDYWEHDVVVELIDQIEDASVLPRCIDGGGACPPEDFGGIEYYAHMLKIFADESHVLHNDVVEWFGEDFDPSYFDPDSATRQGGPFEHRR